MNLRDLAKIRRAIQADMQAQEDGRYGKDFDSRKPAHHAMPPHKCRWCGHASLTDYHPKCYDKKRKTFRDLQ